MDDAAEPANPLSESGSRIGSSLTFGERWTFRGRHGFETSSTDNESRSLCVFGPFLFLTYYLQRGPRPVVTAGLLLASAALAWLAQLGADTGYVAGVLGPLIVIGIGVGMVVAPAARERTTAGRSPATP